MSHLEKLGRRIAAVQDADREALRGTERSAESFIHALRRKGRQRPPRLLWAATLVTAAAIPFLVWFTLLRDAHPLVHSPSAKVSVGDSIVAPRDQTIPLHFSDGSRLFLDSGAKASIRELTAHRARIDVETGKAQVSVVHRAETSWVLRAGPYQVGVTGTKFDVEWLPERERFALELKEGSVVVTTDNSSHAAVRMVAPESLVIDKGVWQLSPLRSGPPSALSAEKAVEPQAPQPSRSVQARKPNPSAPPVQPRSPDAAPAPEDWQSLGKKGKFEQAFARAEALGIAQLSRTAAPADLLALAEVCRFSGHAAQGMAVLTTLRQRFSGREESAIAAFQLGRLSGAGPQAAEWFRTYLRERPKGALAREAAGRLLEVLDRSGNQALATTAAESYLKSYPSGPHAAFARRVLGH